MLANHKHVHITNPSSANDDLLNYQSTSILLKQAWFLKSLMTLMFLSFM